MDKRTYYEVLRVDRNAGPAAIEQAYEMHGRRYEAGPAATAWARDRAERAREAYEVLSSPSKRRDYDEALLRGRPPALQDYTLYRWSLSGPPASIGCYAARSFGDAVAIAADRRAGDLTRLSIPTSENLDGADLGGITLRCMQAMGVSMRNAELAASDLRVAYMANCDLTGANLAWSDLSGAFLADADLTGARLMEAKLTAATLRGADLEGADLRGAKVAAGMLHANLLGADLRGADLAGARSLTVAQVLDAARSVRGGPIDRLAALEGARFPPEIEAAVNAERRAQGLAEPARPSREPNISDVVRRLAASMARVAETAIEGGSDAERREGTLARAATLRAFGAHAAEKLKDAPAVERVVIADELSRSLQMFAGRAAAGFWVGAERLGPAELMTQAAAARAEFASSTMRPQAAENKEVIHDRSRKQVPGISL